MSAAKMTSDHAPDHAHRVEDAIHLAAEDHAGAQVGTGPEQRSRQIEGKEAAIAHAARGGGGDRDGRDAGNELGDEEQGRAVALDQVVGLPHASVRREREAAHGAEHAAPVCPADDEPDVVCEQASEDGDPEELLRSQAASASAPATTSRGAAGSGRPACSRRTAASTSGSPQRATRSIRSMAGPRATDRVGPKPARFRSLRPARDGTAAPRRRPPRRTRPAPQPARSRRAARSASAPARAAPAP